MALFSPGDVGELLRTRGMRSTPQRRAILSVFHGGRTEHLSADEVYAQATRLLPELSRATVYATLAEFSELGLLASFGSPEPVRYETAIEPHAHFRCQLCLRLFDLADNQRRPEQIDAPGFVVERVETRAEGICDECTDYDGGLRAGVESIIASGAVVDPLAVAGVAACEVASPVGPLLLAATPRGLARLAFEEHGDVDALRARAATRRGSRAARRHLALAREALDRYFAAAVPRPDCPVDWEHLATIATALRATEAIPHAAYRSYVDLDDLEPPTRPWELGLIFGANPIPIVTPCHRLTRGTEIPTSFVGGPDRRRWLNAHELANPLP